MKFFIIVTLLFIACSNPETPELSKKEQAQFKKCYIELLQLHQNHHSNTVIHIDSLRNIFHKHALDSIQYNKALKWHNADATRWRKFYTDIIKELENQGNNKKTPAATKKN
ncbi:hypothetical protein KAR48_15490 [bacterium]|nr:hypothetical protein [bacterium]